MTELAALSDVGRIRRGNQDRYLLRRSRGVILLAVADGVGGHAGGEVAAAAAVDALGSAFDFASPDTATALSSAVRAANDSVLKASSERGHPTAASTLVAAVVRGRQCAVANLGDSRAYLVRGRAAQQITADHSGALPSSITRFLGDARGVAPDVFTEVLRPRDRLVLCSDGLTRHVTPDEIAAAASRGGPPRAARALVDLANERGGQDNVTVIVYRSPLLLGRTVMLIVLWLIITLAAVGAIGLLLGTSAAG